MTVARQLLEEALRLKLQLEPVGSDIRVHSPLGKPIPRDLVARMRAHKRELHALLVRRKRAIDLVCAAFARLLDGGATLSDTSNRDAEADAAVTRAFWAAVEEGDFTALRKALADYVQSMGGRQVA